MFKTFIFLIGFGFSVIGSVYLISYLNLLTIGYNFNEYVNFISRRFECYYVIFGLILIIISFIGGKQNELCL